jgi:hypothetical protein
MEEKEKRAAARIEVPLVGTITFDAEGEEPKKIAVVAKDVSVDGAYLRAGAPRACPRVGDKIGISLDCISDFKQLKISLEADGTVVRVDKPQKERHGFAVKFDKVLDS